MLTALSNHRQFYPKLCTYNPVRTVVFKIIFLYFSKSLPFFLKNWLFVDNKLVCDSFHQYLGRFPIEIKHKFDSYISIFVLFRSEIDLLIIMQAHFKGQCEFIILRLSCFTYFVTSSFTSRRKITTESSSMAFERFLIGPCFHRTQRLPVGFHLFMQ